MSCAQAEAFEALLRSLAKHEWVVYAKPPFAGPRQVLDYLARYTHRVALSNDRLEALEGGIGIIQALVSDYERDKLRLNAEMLTRFALALEVSADELLGLKDLPKNGKKTSRKVLRRMERIEDLPPSKQTLILKTLDTLIKGVTA